MQPTRLLVVTVLCSSLFSCATANFQPGKPITHGGPWGTYIQDGERINENEVVEYLKNMPETGAAAREAETWRWISLPPSVVGGFLIGYNLVDSDRTSDTGLWIGVGLAAVGIGAGAHSHAKLTQAVDTYNQHLVTQKKTSSDAIQLKPIFARQLNGAGGSTLAPGVGFTYALK